MLTSLINNIIGQYTYEQVKVILFIGLFVCPYLVVISLAIFERLFNLHSYQLFWEKNNENEELHTRLSWYDGVFLESNVLFIYLALVSKNLIITLQAFLIYTLVYFGIRISHYFIRYSVGWRKDSNKSKLMATLTEKLTSLTGQVIFRIYTRGFLLVYLGYYSHTSLQNGMGIFVVSMLIVLAYLHSIQWLISVGINYISTNFVMKIPCLVKNPIEPNYNHLKEVTNFNNTSSTLNIIIFIGFIFAMIFMFIPGSLNILKEIVFWITIF